LSKNRSYFGTFFFVTTAYASILFAEHNYDKRYSAEAEQIWQQTAINIGNAFFKKRKNPWPDALRPRPDA
jgi:hypothetical protein